MRRADALRTAMLGAGAAVLWMLAAVSPAQACGADGFAGSEITVAVSSAGGLHLGGQHAGQPYLGIDVRNVTSDEVRPLHLRDTRGAEIIHVDHDGPAGKMGLREHDVVVQMNGNAIEDEEQIRHRLRDLSPGNPVVLVISRGGRQLTMSARMGDRDEVERQAWEQHLIAPAAQAPATAMPSGDVASVSGGSGDPAPPSHYSRSFLGSLLVSPSYTGAMLEMMGPQLAQFFGVSSGVGLLVRSVADNSPAARAGLRAGDIVLRANERGMVTLNDWAKQIHKAKGRPVTVTVVRDHEQKVLTLVPDGKRRSTLQMPEEPAAVIYWAWARIVAF